MGARGSRNAKISEEYNEPVLLTGIDNLLMQAQNNGCYEDDKLNIEEVVRYVSSQNPNDPLTLEYTLMGAAVSGSLTYSQGRWTIRVNKNHNRRRQRFTIAHELGHYMMHRNKSQSFTDEIFFRSEKKDNLEYRANEFASKLLMPEDKVKQAISDGVKNVGLLAERFDVSSPAMKARVQELGYKLKADE